ncbi:winged helix-turn-helix domain-containing protein, partial [Streptomyces sp. SM12]|uniref:AfsR/SARP family transcriptional regulator n=1 Tax=Streptomyces sp. SM12 TaxID=1071602 RepID=UPI0015E17663
MRFRVLGPLQVLRDGRWRPVTAPKHRHLLATLLVSRASVVSTPQIIDELWPAAPPASAGTLVRTYVMQLRRLLDDPDGLLVERVAPGYRLRTGPDDLDADHFA